jgi:hypothetical protein
VTKKQVVVKNALEVPEDTLYRYEVKLVHVKAPLLDYVDVSLGECKVPKSKPRLP